MNFVEWVKKSRAYKQASAKANTYTSDKTKMQGLLDKVMKKAQSKPNGQDEGWRSDLTTLWRMTKAYTKGEYKHIPYQTVLLIVATLVYFLMPMDFLPDVLVGIGLFDDVALIGWTIAAIQSDINHFRTYEKKALE
jgi:uncharacterized membrane protein YkvA (DUF1232 family)